ncbi:FASCICLIN-like arabinogalactan protein 14 precursor [Hibiscus trionum]|uniref:FASCICLIN-like arabinogalactan protein 14 n=1 Tax=Hibiscus trionum TaxID=183268 RepID=A0A9W7H9S2_HIBTR|nr:FASCICLIN-like arabinogalactan protein 14 precursor [Hibiscus trionum]
MFPMSSPAVAFSFSLLFLLLASANAAANVDIGKTLSGYSDFSDFSSMLNETGIADQINSMQTVTVLAVSNGNLGALSGLSSDQKKMVMSVHVVLDYYDGAKFNKSHSKHNKILTTLYQETGKARNQVGFLNLTNTGKGPVVFTSAVPNSHLEAQLVKEVTTKPYDLSVLQISNLLDVASVSPAPYIAPAASPPRKVLAPASAPTPTATPTSTPTPSVDEEEDVKSPASSRTKPSMGSEPVAADAPASEEGSSAAASVDYLASTILMISTSAWFLLAMI